MTDELSDAIVVANEFATVTVRKVQRASGLYRAPALDEFGVWRMPE